LPNSRRSGAGLFAVKFGSGLSEPGGWLPVAGNEDLFAGFYAVKQAS
jgi:hypothetical protein